MANSGYGGSLYSRSLYGQSATTNNAVTSTWNATSKITGSRVYYGSNSRSGWQWSSTKTSVYIRGGTAKSSAAWNSNATAAFEFLPILNERWISSSSIKGNLRLANGKSVSPWNWRDAINGQYESSSPVVSSWVSNSTINGGSLWEVQPNDCGCTNWTVVAPAI